MELHERAPPRQEVDRLSDRQSFHHVVNKRSVYCSATLVVAYRWLHKQLLQDERGPLSGFLVLLVQRQPQMIEGARGHQPFQRVLHLLTQEWHESLPGCRLQGLQCQVQVGATLSDSSLLSSRPRSRRRIPVEENLCEFAVRQSNCKRNIALLLLVQLERILGSETQC